MARALVPPFALAVALALGLAGCVTPAAPVEPHAIGSLQLLAAADPAWPDHQNQPHPAFGWPTLTHPGTGSGLPAAWAPIPSAPIPAKIAGLALAAKGPPAVKTGAGIAVFGSLALVPGDSKENYVVDLRDPEHPDLLGTYPGNERGAAIMAMPDGRLYGVVSTAKGFDVVDLNDPTHPEIVANASPRTGGHKLGLVPGTPIVYNANSWGGGGTVGPLANFGADPTGNVPALAKGQTEIYDLSDPLHPLLVKEWKNGYGCHHIFFWIGAQKQRAICAGIEVTQIWDIADPRDPKVIVNVPVHHGNPMLPGASVPFGVAFSHFAILNEKGDVLIVGDELSGGGTPAECDGVHTPAKDAAGPLGNLWFYDIKDEKDPKLKGWISPPPANAPAGDTKTGCTAHHGRLVPDPEGKRQLLAMAWYKAGVVLIDFTDPSDPRIVDEWKDGTDTWEAWYVNGWIVTGDLARGLDVLRLK